MNQIAIDVELTVLGETDVLLFHIDEDNPDKYCINLNSASSQSELKDIFSKLLEMLIENDIYLSFIIADGYSKGLYKDVCAEYIDELNKEIIQVADSIRKELS